MSQEFRYVAQRLLISKKTNILQANNSFWSPTSPTSSSSNNGKKRNILEVIKSTVHTFDKDIIEIGSSCSYKSSKHLRIDYEQYSTFLPIQRYLRHKDSYIYVATSKFKSLWCRHSSYIRAVAMSTVNVHAASPHAMFIGDFGLANVDQQLWIVCHLKRLRFYLGYCTW
ncbi:8996_t:CDS:2 [Funneliformis mosseae]|uniref:8996_t:CDS:1 n=1 Tax=Funneliformis mosseae TaxID=27381 RepID=A0A9N9AD45_FUNMO|nr:8996_t:CDS:2 [Funneliformis mosseae]